MAWHTAIRTWVYCGHKGMDIWQYSGSLWHCNNACLVLMADSDFAGIHTCALRVTVMSQSFISSASLNDSRTSSLPRFPFSSFFWGFLFSFVFSPEAKKSVLGEVFPLLFTSPHISPDSLRNLPRGIQSESPYVDAGIDVLSMIHSKEAGNAQEESRGHSK